MAGMNASSEMFKKERVGQQTLPATGLEASAAQELETVRHHGSPRSVGISGTECAMLKPIGLPHSLEPLSSSAAVHFSGAVNDTRPLLFYDTQFTDEKDEKTLSSATGLSTNDPPSMDTLRNTNIRGHDPGTAASSAERPSLHYPPILDNDTNRCAKLTAQHDGVKDAGHETIGIGVVNGEIGVAKFTGAVNSATVTETVKQHVIPSADPMGVGVVNGEIGVAKFSGAVSYAAVAETVNQQVIPSADSIGIGVANGEMGVAKFSGAVNSATVAETVNQHVIPSADSSGIEVANGEIGVAKFSGAVNSKLGVQTG